MGRVDTGRVAVRGEAASHNYASEWIAQLARAIRDWPQPAETWCIFDNTASGAAVENAWELHDLLVQDGVALEGR